MIEFAKDPLKWTDSLLQYYLSISPNKSKAGRNSMINFWRLNGETLERIAKVIGVTKERVRQIETRNFRVLSHPSRMNIK